LRRDWVLRRRSTASTNRSSTCRACAAISRTEPVAFERIHAWVGIPCGVGIGATKTLAKLANHIAKTAERKPGSYAAEHAQVCNLCALTGAELDDLFKVTEVGEVWGVGRRIAAQLQAGGIVTVLDLVRMDPATVRSRWSVVLERTVRELQGLSGVDFDDAPGPKKQIACTRSFGRTVKDLPQLLEAVSEFATRAGEKLRRQTSVAGQLLVFAHTSPHRPGPRFHKTVTVPLRRPTAETPLLVQAAVRGMRQIFEPGFDLVKAGVMLLDLAPAGRVQAELALDGDVRDEQRERLMTAMDTLNDRYGKGTLHVACTGASNPREWSMRQDRKTPNYTTAWSDVPVARA
jgi:DNA polymerase V